MRKSVLRLLLPVLTALLLCVLLAATAAAVPPAPGVGGETGGCPSHPGAAVSLNALPAKRGGGIPVCAVDPAAPEKELPLAVIVVEFPNEPYREDFDWSGRIFTGAESLRQYYQDQSYGQFTFAPVAETSVYDGETNRNRADGQNDGVIHVSVSVPHDDWSFRDDFFSEADYAHARTIAVALSEAIEKAGAYVDFSAYDANGDGQIANDELAVGFVVAGLEAASASDKDYAENGSESYLWSHAWSIGEIIRDYGLSDLPVPSPGGTAVSAYISISEQVYPDTQEPISVLAHELGHYLGLPDLYDTDYEKNREWSAYSVDDLSVMAGGSWGTDPETGAFRPYSFDVWSKIFLGWVAPMEAENNTSYTLRGIGEHPEALRIRTSREHETYLVENRRFTGWDAGMARSYGPDGGLILWHIDQRTYDTYEADNAVNNGDHHPAVMPLYPETDETGAVSFLGNAGKPAYARPVFSAASWAELCAPSLGASLELPLYGAEGEEDLRSARRLSGIHVRFTSDSADEMTLELGDPPHEHDLTFVPETAPTCGASGVKAHYHCEICGRNYLDETAETEVTAESLVLPPVGEHSWNEGEVTTAPTCVDAGVRTFTCTVCGQTYTENEPATGEHTWDGGVMTNAPTCGAAGLMIYTCTVCGATRPEALPAVGEHTWDGGVRSPAPTCVDSGLLIYTCTVCGERAAETLDALGHSWSEWTVDLPATAAEAGQESRMCARCLTVETREIPPTGGPEPLPGDVDLDGSVTAADARLALRRAVLLETFAEDSLEFLAADVDGDGAVTAGDARAILRAAVGLEALRRREA